MWRNADVLDFVGWLRAHNDAAPRGQRVGFYGLDLYSLHASMEAVLAYLDQVDPEARRGARATATRASTTSATTRRRTATRPRFGLAPVVRGRGGRAARRAAAPRPTYARA